MPREVNRSFVATVRLSRVHVDRCTQTSSVKSEPEEARGAATHPSAPCGACTTLFGRQRGAACRGAVRDSDCLAAIRTCAAGSFRSETRVGRGRQGLLLEDDAAVRVPSVGALISRALWAAKVVASDGRMSAE
jgi:hypothetical protein